VCHAKNPQWLSLKNGRFLSRFYSCNIPLKLANVCATMHYFYRPAVEMWLPTTDSIEPDCSPDLHPPIVMSYHPECALFNKLETGMVSSECACNNQYKLFLSYMMVYLCRPSRQTARRKVKWPYTSTRYNITE
jgi:hypothetical protein